MDTVENTLEIHPFPRGAEWVRADFHLHTLSDTGGSRKDYRREFAEDKNQFVPSFIQRLKDEKVRVGVITNHNQFDLGEYKALAKAARKENIFLLPGVELGIRGGGATIHTLLAFEPATLTKDNDFISRFLISQFPAGNPSEGTATKDDFLGCFTGLDHLGVDYFAVFAHADSNNGLLSQMKKTELEPIYSQMKTTWEQRILGLQHVNSEEHHVRSKLPEGMPIPAFVEGSDPQNSIAQVARKENGVSYLKVSDLSFHSVKFALRDHVLRVRREEPPRPARPTIQSVEINGGKREYAAYQFSDNLNTLIGSRGSGKSIVIEALRWCLGKDAGEGDRGYKNELLHVFLDKGATVTVKGMTALGEDYSISRSYISKTTQALPTVTVAGTTRNIDPESVLPGLLYFGQKDLGARQEKSNEQIFKQLLPSPDEARATAETKAKAEYEKAIDAYLLARQAKENDDELKFEEDTLKKKLDELNKHGVGEKLAEITAFDQDRSKVSQLVKDVQAEKDGVAEAVPSPDEVVSWQAILKAKANLEMQESLDRLRATYDLAHGDVQTAVEKLGTVITGLSEVEEKLEEKQQDLQGHFAKILREIDFPELDVDEYRRMVKRQGEIAELRKKTDDRKGKLEAFEKDLIAKGKLWHAALKDISRFQQEGIDEINKDLGENIQLKIEFQSDKTEARKFYDGVFRGSGFNTQSYERLVEVAHTGLDAFANRESIMRTDLSAKMGETFERILFENLKDILLFSAPDDRFIAYENTRINELSLGMRAMALLLLLLSLKNHPIIIIDQPEDDLDNETIHKLIVNPLIDNKDAIQFLMATHNPNLPVLGDAEQVIACYEVSRGEFEEKTGSLDRTNIKDAIINIMEGGDEAFRKRHDIYGLWAQKA